MNEPLPAIGARWRFTDEFLRDADPRFITDKREGEFTDGDEMTWRYIPGTQLVGKFTGGISRLYERIA